MKRLLALGLCLALLCPAALAAEETEPWKRGEPGGNYVTVRLPCPAGIEINNCARMSLMLRRAPQAGWLSEEWQEKMKKIEGCLHCGKCMEKCPYGLNTPELLAKNYEDYKTFL